MQSINIFAHNTVFVLSNSRHISNKTIYLNQKNRKENDYGNG